MKSVSAIQVRLEAQLSEVLDLVSKATSVQAMEDIRVRFLGKKSAITEVLASLKDLSPDERKQVGAVSHSVRQQIESAIEEKKLLLEAEALEKQLQSDDLDTGFPGTYVGRGAFHPVYRAMTEIREILERVGLQAVYGPEVEKEEYCFDRLNFKPEHPARDMQATFFVPSTASESLVMRTHTSPVQVRVLLELAKKDFPLPVRIQVPGRVYRVDDDATHSPMFHQVEGLVVDKRSGMGDLRAVLDYFFRNFFGHETKIRFRPSFFPFTEPSAEVDVSCVFCKGAGCKICKHSGWLEVAGAGLVHPEVFKACGWNPDEVQGWAFGMGVDRLAMLKYQIPDLRLLFENRLSFLRGGE